MGLVEPAVRAILALPLSFQVLRSLPSNASVGWKLWSFRLDSTQKTKPSIRGVGDVWVADCADTIFDFLIMVLPAIMPKTRRAITKYYQW